ncbi:TetR family transcriptional regulator [Oceanomicrobium pacificus]|uniref:TetR family transcriptional regulator n=1 Tax=Oceanomicrobium pacificus TaxID=2692916 RepID=A0A6B0U5N5_9RHOB|nr:TetR family transcriptional regulator [Oceanomicrobium pacificus]MXU66221.1 TetR family transcriptional regulator [Oceanomicrobium pacificus]
MTPAASSPKRRPRPRKRDAEASRRRILDAALEEFSAQGHAGARIDTIAEKAEVSKPMIYSYFGDKDALYAAALRESYVQIRAGERELQTDDMPPEDAIRELVRFTLQHFVSRPWFIALLNTENLRGGDTITQIADVAEIQSPLIAKLGQILRRGAAEGIFRDDIDPAEFYITIASLCYFPVSNRHTLGAVFKVEIDAEWLDRKAQEAGEMLIRYLRVDGGAGNG